MLKKIRMLRLSISFVNYLICLYGLYVFDFFSAIKIPNFIKIIIVLVVSVVVLLFELAITYLRKNSNVLFNIIYTIALLVILFEKQVDNSHSDFLLLGIVFVIMFIAIFLHYLRIFEIRIDKIQKKGAREDEIKEAYSKYMKILVGVIGIMLVATILISFLVWNIASYFIMYLYSIHVVFSIPAVIGLILISLIGVFVLVK